MNRILPVAFTRDEAQAAGTYITISAEKATSSCDGLIGEIQDFIDRKGYAAMDWKKKKRQKFFEKLVKPTGLDYGYFCFLHKCAEFAIEIDVDFAGEMCKPIRAICAVAKKDQHRIWDQAKKQCGTDVPDTSMIKKLIEDQRESRSANANDAPKTHPMAYESNTIGAHAKSRRVKSIMRHLPSDAFDLHNLFESLGTLVRDAELIPLISKHPDISLMELRQLYDHLKSEVYVITTTGTCP